MVNDNGNDHGRRQRQAIAPLVAGISGGSARTVLLMPLDIAKVRLQVREDVPGQHRIGSLRILRGIVNHEGFAGLYQGIAPALMGSAVSWGGYFFLYEAFKEQLRSYRRANIMADQSTNSILVTSRTDPEILSSWDTFQLACAASAVMVGVTNPVWLIKLRMQLQMKQAAEQLNTKVKPYDGMIDACRTIVREEGPMALYKGSGPALLLTSHGGVQFAVYEYLKKQFHFSRPQRNSESSLMDRFQMSAGYLTMGVVSKIVASTTTYPLQVIKARMQQRSETVELTSEGGVQVVKRQYFGLTETAAQIWRNEGILGFFKGCTPNAVRVAPSAAIMFVVYESTMDWLKY